MLNSKCSCNEPSEYGLSSPAKPIFIELLSLTWQTRHLFLLVKRGSQPHRTSGNESAKTSPFMANVAQHLSRNNWMMSNAPRRLSAVWVGLVAAESPLLLAMLHQSLELPNKEQDWTILSEDPAANQEFRAIDKVTTLQERILTTLDFETV